MGKLESLVETADTKIHPIPFITTIYPLAGGALDKSRDPKDYFHSPAVLKQMIETATEKSDGLGLFWFPLYAYDTDHLLEATIFRPQDNDDASYDHKLTNSEKSMLTSWFQAIEEQVPAGEVKLTFDARDSRTTAECGWLFKQALIDGKVVWSKDVCKDGKERETVSVKATTSQAAQVVIRIFAAKANHMSLSMYVTTPVVTVGGKRIASNWTFDSTLANLADFKQMYNTVKSVLKAR